MIKDEIESMLEKTAIQVVSPVIGEFISSVFLVPKRDGGNRPVINLKNLNYYVTYQHFKMEGLHLLKQILQNDKNRSQGCLFLCAYTQQPSPFLEIYVGMEALPVQLPSLWSRASPFPFHQIAEASSVPVTKTGSAFDYISGRYIRDRDSTLWLLQHLGFVINWKKSVLIPAQEMEYLGFVINSLEMTLALPEKKLQDLVHSCRQLLQSRMSTVREISRLVGKLTSAMQAILPAPLHYRHLQMLQIQSLLAGKSYETEITLNQSCKEDLQWWIDQITNWNGRSITIPPPDLIITTDASLKGWGAVCQGIHTRGLWTPQEASQHINVLELKAALFAVRAFTANKTCLHVHLRMDNRTAIAYVLKMGGTRSTMLLHLAQELWDYALSKSITLTGEYLPGVLNTQADWESRHFQDSSDWKLHPVCSKH